METTSVFCPLVFVTLSCTFRYGRDDMDVMGIAFRRELYLSTRQVYPPLQDREKCIHTRIQAKLLRKLGDNAFPFFFEVTSCQRHCPPFYISYNANLIFQTSPPTVGL